MTRLFLIRRLIREVYGEQPRNDAAITDNLVNSYLNDGIALAAKQNYKDNVALEGIGYVNNSFYTTFKGLPVVSDERFMYKIVLPDFPIGIGENDGVPSLQFKDSNGYISQNCIPMSISQKNYTYSRPIPNKILYYPEGKNIYAKSAISLTAYTASVGMVSGGDSTNLNSDLNVPSDYIPVIEQYVIPILMRERSVQKDLTNDGKDS